MKDVWLFEKNYKTRIHGYTFFTPLLFGKVLWEYMDIIKNLDRLELKYFIESAPIGILVCDDMGKILFVNSKMEAIFGYEKHDLIGHPVEVLVPDSKENHHRNSRQSFMEDKRSRMLDEGRVLKGKRSDGTTVSVEIGITILENGINSFAVAFVLDLQGQRRQGERIRNILKTMPFGLLLVSSDGKIQMSNSEFNRIFGYADGELHESDVDVLVPEDKRIGHKAFREAFNKVPQSRRMGAGRDLKARRKSGELFPAEIAITPFREGDEYFTLVAITDISERKQLEETLRQKSLYDNLTGLPNRNLFFDRLSHEFHLYKRQKVGFAVLMIDLNRFKEVNDSLGHLAGDIVLHEVGLRLLQVSRKSDTLARLGGDEFAAILCGVEEQKQAVAHAQTMVNALSAPIAANGHALSIGLSIGIALCPRHGENQKQLIANADHAMYEAKRSLQDIVVKSNSKKIKKPTQSIVSDIEKALSDGEFYFEYQPQVYLDSNLVAGVEALIRWKKNEDDTVQPSQFIPEVEQSNILELFTFSTFDIALNDYRSLRENYAASFSMSLNLSARMLEHPTLVSKISDLLSKHKIPPNLITIEITETALVINPIAARRVIQDLVDLGVNFSIDDFGVGFTSYQYLRSFPFSEIKIDQIFVTHLLEGSFDYWFIHSIEVFCKGLGIRTVVEGIENSEQLNCLRSLSSNIGQGFGIARPMTLEKLVSWISGASV